MSSGVIREGDTFHHGPDKRVAVWSIEDFYDLADVPPDRAIKDTYGYFDMIHNEYVLVVELEPAIVGEEQK